VGTRGSLISRRRLGGLGVAVAIAPLVACRGRDRASVLRSLVREVVADLAQDMLVTSRTLHETLRQLAQAPDAASAGPARAALVAALTAWKRASAFRSGPFASSHAFQRAAFWPARPIAIQRVLAADDAIDEARVEGLAVDAKGLYALEYSLFEPTFEKLLESPGEMAAKRLRRYALEVAKNVRGYGQRVVRQLGDDGAYARAFAADGQRSLSELVAQEVDTLAMLGGKLARIPRADALAEPRAMAVEGYFSRSSLQVALALLSGAERLYSGAGGGGMSTLAGAVSETLDAELRAGFHDCATRLRALGKPLDVAFDTDQQAYTAVGSSIEALQHSLKVNLASALEV
jgi:predicted lipoprotein